MSFSYSDYHFTGKVNRGSDHRPLLLMKTASAGICGGIPTMLNDHPTWVVCQPELENRSTSVRYTE
jgi:hypothetical protein